MHLKFLNLAWVSMRVNEVQVRSQYRNHCVTKPQRKISPLSTQWILFSITELQPFLHTSFNKIKCFHSLEVLDLLGTLMSHQVLELLVLPGTPERKTGNKRARWRKKVTGSRGISRPMYQSDLTDKMLRTIRKKPYNWSRGSLSSLWSNVTRQTLRDTDERLLY